MAQSPGGDFDVAGLDRVMAIMSSPTSSPQGTSMFLHSSVSCRPPSLDRSTRRVF